jgi:hypothetical protein
MAMAALVGYLVDLLVCRLGSVFVRRGEVQ